MYVFHFIIYSETKIANSQSEVFRNNATVSGTFIVPLTLFSLSLPLLRSITRACTNLTVLDKRMVDAVEARQELDLRIGKINNNHNLAKDPVRGISSEMARREFFIL